MDFKKVYQGAVTATPDGQLPKLNEPEVDKAGRVTGAKDGRYVFEVISTSEFKSWEAKTMSYKIHLKIVSSDTGRFKPGTEASIVVHNFRTYEGGNSIEDFNQVKSFGTVKAFLAPALSDKYGEEIKATDPDCGESDDPSETVPGRLGWDRMFYNSTKNPDLVAGARVVVQTVSSKSDKGFPFVKMFFSRADGAESKAA
jgi:hypothetical protein